MKASPVIPMAWSLLIVATQLAQASLAADATNGYRLATANCAQCHNIEKGATGKQHPHSFQAIATYYEADDIHARIFAPSLHLGMPDVGWKFTRQEIDDLVAYIMTLDTSGTPQAQ